MTGVAVVTSPHACDQLRDIFIKEYLDESSFSVKTAWQTLAMCKAAIEITSGDKRSTNKIHSDMIVKYQRWSNLICSDAETVLNLHNPPEYLQPALFMTDMKLFMDQVIYGLYMYKMKEKNQAIDKHLVFDHDDKKGCWRITGKGGRN